jgi:ABC-type iron transport system FetAB ATPase subunit
MTVDLSVLWPIAGTAAGFLITWGSMRATLAELRREIVELKTINATVTGIDKRLSLLEADVHRLDGGQKAHHSLLRGLQRRLDKAGLDEVTGNGDGE